MGHTSVQVPDNPLYGHKGDLKTRLGDCNPPRWLLDSYRPANASSIDGDTLAEKVAEKAQQTRDARKRVRENPHGDPTTVTRTLELAVDTDRLPDDIAEHLPVSRKHAQETTGFHHIQVRHPMLAIEVGPRGGIADVSFVVDTHH
jgi:hypothetical protein